jgi:pimeloyl-ACP methyl ester carboxylesterase
MDAIAKYKATRNKLFKRAGIELAPKYVTTDGPIKRVHYLELGEGDPLILVHGGLSNSSEWINILKPLSQHSKLYVVDRPGHGLSDPIDYRGMDYRQNAVDFLRSFMDAVGLTKATFLANSMGGYFSISFAMDHPERVEHLMLIGAPAGMNYWIPYPLRLLGMPGLNRFLMRTVAKPRISEVKRIYKQLVVKDISNLSEDHFEHMYHLQLLPASIIAFSTLLESVLTIRGWRKELYIGDQLHRLKIPVGFIWGDADAFEAPETGIKKAKSIENHSFAVVEDAGHCPWFDQPEKCTALILEMLEQGR